MLKNKLTEKDLKRELQDFRDRFPKLADDHLFVLWFLRAFITEDEREATDALCGGSNDKGVDAVLIDADTKSVFVVQGKYHQKVNGNNEHRNDVLGFAELALNLSCNAKGFSKFCDDISPEVHSRLSKARKRILEDNFQLQLFYVTTGKCSDNLEREAEQITRSADCTASFQVFDGRQVLLLLDDYLGGVAPPVPSLDLEMESGNGVDVKGIFHRHDTKTDIESWIFSMTSHGVVELFEHAGNRLFARNIRGFLGSTEINRGMEDTLDKEPEYFWYYNNGITVICDDAQETSAHGKHILRVKNPQVINGQQTTRTLSRVAAHSSKASVTIKVIRVTRRGDGTSEQFDTLVSKIVQATNWQNAIRASDLVSNDRRQIELERQMRKLGYWYIRKRQTKGEARRIAGSRRYILVSKDKIAQAVAGCDFDPAVVREGKEGLFEERLYGSVFPTTDPFYYLSRYWMMDLVGYAARGYPERAYAKWLVLHFVWSQVAPLLRSQAKMEHLHHDWEHGGKVLEYLFRMNNTVFSAALRFYRLKRGKGARATDVSTFFKRKNLHKEFAKFWNSPHNNSRTSFRRALKNTARELRKDEY